MHQVKVNESSKSVYHNEQYHFRTIDSHKPSCQLLTASVQLARSVIFVLSGLRLAMLRISWSVRMSSLLSKVLRFGASTTLLGRLFQLDTK